MKTKGKRPRDAAELRRLAEHRLQERKAEKAQPPTEQDTRRLLHELQVHQVELEMQNEELIAARSEVEAVLERYTDLYDFAPVGYFTLDRDGAIRQVNITGASLLGIERAKLVRHGLGRFVAPDDLNHWDRHLASVLHSDEKHTCELALKREDGSTFFARLESIRSDRPAQEAGDGGTGPAICVAMSDITDLKRAHGKLTEALAQLVRSNKELESFAYSVSHDLRGPLITVTCFLGRLARDSKQGNVKAMHSDLAYIGEAITKMDRLLHDLLELSRIGR
ncbi:MAG: PAS domain S-box protein, partial [Acidobacteria bacterium]|nr:PAS domain S-box protein [Acidobacteriota bacterium]